MPLARTHVRLGLAVTAALALTVLAGCSSDGSSSSAGSKADARTVSATATGTATGTPDQLVADVGISNQGTSAADVLAQNNAKTQALLDQFTAAGIDEKDIATTSVDLGPSYDDNGNIDGYQATNMVRVTLRDLTTAGKQLDAVVKAGGNDARVQSVSLGFNEDDELLTKARVDAIERAKSQATEMAEAAGAKLGRVRTITDVVDSGGDPMFKNVGAESAADSSVPIAAGSQDLTVQVRVVYELA